MPGGGLVEIHAGNETVAPKNPYRLPEARFVCVTVRDRGVGIAPEHLDGWDKSCGARRGWRSQAPVETEAAHLEVVEARRLSPRNDPRGS